MNTTSVIDRLAPWLQLLPEKSHSNEDGTCRYEYPGFFTLTFDVVIQNEEQLLIYTTLAALNAKNRLVLCHKLLELNFFCQQTDGAMLSLAPHSDDIILSYAHPFAMLDGAAFVALIDNFLATAARLKQSLADGDDKPPNQMGDEDLIHRNPQLLA